MARSRATVVGGVFQHMRKSDQLELPAKGGELREGEHAEFAGGEGSPCGGDGGRRDVYTQGLASGALECVDESPGSASDVEGPGR
jgi:hypothetical protein